MLGFGFILVLAGGRTLAAYSLQNVANLQRSRIVLTLGRSLVRDHVDLGRCMRGRVLEDTGWQLNFAILVSPFNNVLKDIAIFYCVAQDPVIWAIVGRVCLSCFFRPFALGQREFISECVPENFGNFVSPEGIWLTSPFFQG